MERTERKLLNRREMNGWVMGEEKADDSQEWKEDHERERCEHGQGVMPPPW